VVFGEPWRAGQIGKGSPFSVNLYAQASAPHLMKDQAGALKSITPIRVIFEVFCEVTERPEEDLPIQEALKVRAVVKPKQNALDLFVPNSH
jgi:hypothetical protein